MEGAKAHSWNDAFNRCMRITNGHAFPIIIDNQEAVTLYLKEEFKRLNIKPGKATIQRAAR